MVAQPGGAAGCLTAALMLSDVDEEGFCVTQTSDTVSKVQDHMTEEVMRACGSRGRNVTT